MCFYRWDHPKELKLKIEFIYLCCYAHLKIYLSEVFCKVIFLHWKCENLWYSLVPLLQIYFIDSLLDKVTIQPLSSPAQRRTH